MYNMDYSMSVLVFVAAVLTSIALLLGGIKVERMRIYDKCMAESSQMILAEATAKCKEIVK